MGLNEVATVSSNVSFITYVLCDDAAEVASVKKVLSKSGYIVKNGTPKNTVHVQGTLRNDATYETVVSQLKSALKKGGLDVDKSRIVEAKALGKLTVESAKTLLDQIPSLLKEARRAAWKKVYATNPTGDEAAAPTVEISWWKIPSGGKDIAQARGTVDEENNLYFPPIRTAVMLQDGALFINFDALARRMQRPTKVTNVQDLRAALTKYAKLKGEDADVDESRAGESVRAAIAAFLSEVTTSGGVGGFQSCVLGGKKRRRPVRMQEGRWVTSKGRRIYIGDDGKPGQAPAKGEKAVSSTLTPGTVSDPSLTQWAKDPWAKESGENVKSVVRVAKTSFAVIKTDDGHWLVDRSGAEQDSWHATEGAAVKKAKTIEKAVQKMLKTRSERPGYAD